MRRNHLGEGGHKQAESVSGKCAQGGRRGRNGCRQVGTAGVERLGRADRRGRENRKIGAPESVPEGGIKMGVSKTDFVRGLQCPKMLWLDSHRPELKIIPEEVQRRLDAGNEFGDGAMGIFGEYRETTCYRPDGRLDFAQMIARTQEWLKEGIPVVCEAAFSYRGNYCAADILRKNGEVYDLYEVKNAPAPRREFLLDLGFQSFLIGRCGVLLGRRFLILNGEKIAQNTQKDGGESSGAFGENGRFCVKRGDDTEEIGDRVEVNGRVYRIADETAAARRLEKTAEKNLWRFAKIKGKDAPEPGILPGEQCDSPYRCWYYDFCHGEEGGGKA